MAVQTFLLCLISTYFILQHTKNFHFPTLEILPGFVPRRQDELLEMRSEDRAVVEKLKSTQLDLLN